MRVRDLVDKPELALTVLAGEESLDRPIRWVYTTDLLDPGRYLSGGELVLTGLIWRRGPEDSETFAAAVAAADVAAVAAGDAVYGEIPLDLIEACRRHGVTLIEVPIDISFATVTEDVSRRLAEESGSGIAGVLSKRRRLVNAIAEGDGLDGLVRVWSHDNDIPCALLSTSGRQIASAATLEESDVDTLVRAFLTAQQVPAVVRLAGDRRMSVFPVGARGLVGWFLAGEGTHDQWPREARESVMELASLAGVERSRTEEGSRARHRFGDQIIPLVTSAVRNPAELAARLRAADLEPEAAFVAVVVSAHGMTGPVDVPRALIDEQLGPVFPSLMVARMGSETVALIPVGSAAHAPSVARLLREAGERLERAMGRRRLVIGVSGPAQGSVALRGAIDEARHVRGLAELRPPRVAVATADEVDSHMLLIASVPDDVRETFRTRVLGPVLRYDSSHNSELVSTLQVFLDCSGSWQRTAELLHVHVNTLRYRMQRVEELTGRSLSSLEDRVDLFLALRIRSWTSH
ncbi:PucR family transcriptional regulator [Actinokineospora xionganensis]|uniref:PucR family transcriptional regulator ligand-binding domain-containing protein n=1 Tax=Actinokineospora xionganensis TaxID=2684470 RepID=A0ABR7L0A9_9PSEU|nr:PucR family transcriptional regulator [Actinokineospora xionganensis]MBC6446125.1 PucR family transcriptional regulator ligand-binding domain-containing protein [Actinokineospora xionganensis]